MSAQIIPLREPRTISVWFDDEGWNVRMGALHKAFWDRWSAGRFIDILLLQHIATVEVIGEVPEE